MSVETCPARGRLTECADRDGKLVDPPYLQGGPRVASAALREPQGAPRARSASGASQADLASASFRSHAATWTRSRRRHLPNMSAAAGRSRSGRCWRRWRSRAGDFRPPAWPSASREATPGRNFTSGSTPRRSRRTLCTLCLAAGLRATSSRVRSRCSWRAGSCSGRLRASGWLRAGSPTTSARHSNQICSLRRLADLGAVHGGQHKQHVDDGASKHAESSPCVLGSRPERRTPAACARLPSHTLMTLRSFRIRLHSRVELASGLYAVLVS